MKCIIDFIFGREARCTPSANVSEIKKPFNWEAVREKAKIEIEAQALINLEKYQAALKKAKENFKISVSVFKNSSIKIVLENKMYVIPLDEIRNVSLSVGCDPKISKRYYVLNKDGSFTADRDWYHFNEESTSIIADYANIYCPDKIFITPNIKFALPFGLGVGIMEEIQELLAKYESK